jgi:two-component system OmpR family sensor kinase/two-component system phosphate regulon sensor histidine kinase PhoR
MFIITVLALFFISKNFSRSIDRLRIFTQKAEQDDILDTDIQFPNDELGEISNNIVQLYRRMLESKTDADRQREKLFKHLQISREGLGIFSSDKKKFWQTHILFNIPTFFPIRKLKVQTNFYHPGICRNKFFY